MFYQISKSIDPNVIGTDSLVQAETAIYPVEFDDPLHIWKWNFKEIPDYVPIPIPKVKAKAKLTDLMSVYFTGSGGRLTISNKLKIILEKYSSDKVQYLSLPMQHKGRQVEGYWLTNILDFDNDKIDYDKSKIEVHSLGGTKMFDIKITSYQHFEQVKLKLEYPERIYIRKVIVNNLTLDNFLFFEKVYGGVGYYVSEKLKAEIESAGCTGVDFEPLEQA